MLFPEIEDDAFLEGVLQRAEGIQTNVDYVEVAGGRLTFREALNDNTLKDVVDGFSSAREPCLRIFFIKVAAHGWFKTGQSILLSTQSMELLRDRVGLLSQVIRSMYTKGQWSTMGQSRFISRNKSGKTLKFEMIYKPVLGWKDGYSLVQLSATPTCSTYFCVNYTIAAQRRLCAILKEDISFARRPFMLDALIMQFTAQAWAGIMDKERESFVDLEKGNLIEKVNSQLVEVDFTTQDLHMMSRTFHILEQDLDDTLETLRFLLEAYKEFNKTFPNILSSIEADPSREYGRADDSLHYIKSRISSYRGWASNYRDRTNIQINLLFHLSSQLESRTNTRIADQTAKVAQLTQRDSASMITIAAVTMFFLPGTFVSAILSTTFFDYGKEGLEVSNQWWVFLAATIPLTIAVFGVWFAWRYRRLQNYRANVNDDEKTKLL